ncbi:unnamed protein product, partial [Prorocentrum cordatum]
PPSPSLKFERKHHHRNAARAPPHPKRRGAMSAAGFGVQVLHRADARASPEDLDLPKGRYGFGVSWDTVRGRSVDIDLQCVVVDRGGAIVDCAYYNNLKAAGAITHSGDEAQGKPDNIEEMVWVNMRKVQQNVSLLVFVVAAYSGGNLQDVSNGRLHVLEEKQTNEIALFEMERSKASVDVVAAMFRTGPGGQDWKLRIIDVPAQAALGQEHSGGARSGRVSMCPQLFAPSSRLRGPGPLEGCPGRHLRLPGKVGATFGQDHPWKHPKRDSSSPSSRDGGWASQCHVLFLRCSTAARVYISRVRKWATAACSLPRVLHARGSGFHDGVLSRMPSSECGVSASSSLFPFLLGHGVSALPAHPPRRGYAQRNQKKQ